MLNTGVGVDLLLDFLDFYVFKYNDQMSPAESGSHLTPQPGMDSRQDWNPAKHPIPYIIFLASQIF